MPKRFNKRLLNSCYRALSDVYQDICSSESEFADEIAAVPESRRDSIVNFVHYLNLRRHDIRRTQIQLGFLGLSSLGRLEAHVLAGVESVLAVLERLTDTHSPKIFTKNKTRDFQEGDKLLAQHTKELLGKKPSKRSVRIMVTLPSEAATQPVLVKNLLQKGMNVARINCAHDTPYEWASMIAHLRAAEKSTGRSCRIMMDLAGPKLRTGEIGGGPNVVHIKPQRDPYGHITLPAQVLIYPQSRVPAQGDVENSLTLLPIDDQLANACTPGATLVFTDIPGRKRSLIIYKRDNCVLWAHAYRSVYLYENHPLKLILADATVCTGTTGTFTKNPRSILLRQGDILKLVPSDNAGTESVRNSNGQIVEPACVPCTLPQVFHDTVPGNRIFFDDGKIGGIIEDVKSDEILVRITNAKTSGQRLKSDKGINLPDSTLSVPALSVTDLEHLDFAVNHADIVGLSFVREPQDVELLHNEIKKRTTREIGVVLKIENRQAFENLPRLLLTALRKPPVGVMVARGDLGVEVGFERMAEVQEQILWLCEAAHVPVIWATQVLEQMNKKGSPTRGEVTDAAMSSRAECVMLNKGPFVVETVAFLENILIRMQDHHHKKSAMLRKLKVSEGRWRTKKKIAKK